MSSEIFQMKFSKTDLSLFFQTAAKCKMCVSFHIFVGGDAHPCMGDIEISTVKFNLIHFSLISGLPPVGRKYLRGYKIFSFSKNNFDHQSKHYIVRGKTQSYPGRASLITEIYILFHILFLKSELYKLVS